MAKIKFKQVKSSIGRPERQKRTLAALGVTKLHKVKELEVTPQVQGMINKVKHLLEIVE